MGLGGRVSYVRAVPVAGMPLVVPDNDADSVSAVAATDAAAAAAAAAMLGVGWLVLSVSGGWWPL